MSPEIPTPPEEEPQEPNRAWPVIAQFFLVPLLVVAVCVGIFFLFSLLTFEHKTPAQYLADVRGGAANQRWQSAFELSRAVARVAPGPAREKLGAQTLEVFVNLKTDRPEDREVKRYLALVLGRLAYAPARPALEGATRDPDPQIRLYSVWALGMLGDPAAVPSVLEQSASDDPGARKMSAYILGKLNDARAIPRLKVLAGDPVADVRWNAAIALAELRDDSGREVLHSMLDRASLARQAPGLTEAQAEEALVNALKAEVLVRDRAALDQIRRLETGDGNLRVRDQARQARTALEGQS